MNVRLLEPAERELGEAIAYYNAQVAGSRNRLRHAGVSGNKG